MRNNDRVGQAARSYCRFGLWIIAGITLASLLMMNVMQSFSLMNSLLASALFSLVTMFLYGIAWKYVARNYANSLSLFYLAGSGLRMIVAGMAVLIVYFLVPDYGVFRDFALIFVAFYIVMLGYDAYFFARYEKNNIKV